MSLHLSLTLQDQIDRTKLRFDKYGKQGLLCGAEGLPHLIADAEEKIASEQAIIADVKALIAREQASHAGEFVLLAILAILWLEYLIQRNS